MLFEHATDVLASAIETHKPDWVFALVSGGHDSASMLHFVKDQIDFAVHIDTGIGIPQTRKYVESLCQHLGVQLKVYAAAESTDGEGNPDPQVYEDIVREHGFPGPGNHRIMYARLKERPLRVMMRQHPGVKLLVTGVRSTESSRRMGYVEPIRIETKNKVWVAPCHYWTEHEQRDYMALHEIPRNPVKDCLGMSGECLCGAFAYPGELTRLRELFPDTAARIDALETEIRYIHPWGWEDRPPRIKYVAKEQMDIEFAPLCIGCESTL